MRTNQIVLFASLLLMLVIASCSKDIITPREYPRVKTLEVSNISKTGATFNAEIIYQGNQKIIEHGFVWMEYKVLNEVLQSPSLEYSEKVVITQPITTGVFNSEISNAFDAGTKYTIRAYARSNEYLVYGKFIFFTSLN